MQVEESVVFRQLEDGYVLLAITLTYEEINSIIQENAAND